MRPNAPFLFFATLVLFLSGCALQNCKQVPYEGQACMNVSCNVPTVRQECKMVDYTREFQQKECGMVTKPVQECGTKQIVHSLTNGTCISECILYVAPSTCGLVRARHYLMVSNLDQQGGTFVFQGLFALQDGEYATGNRTLYLDPGETQTVTFEYSLSGSQIKPVYASDVKGCRYEILKVPETQYCRNVTSTSQECKDVVKYVPDERLECQNVTKNELVWRQACMNVTKYRQECA